MYNDTQHNAYIMYVGEVGRIQLEMPLCKLLAFTQINLKLINLRATDY